MQLVFAALSDVGRVRARNEDATAMAPESGLFIVCDGMGGTAGGAIASALAARVALREARNGAPYSNPETRWRRAIASANEAVLVESTRDRRLRGMGTTLVGACFADRSVSVAHVGDSRCYRFRHGQLTALTNDHSWVEERVAAGAMTMEQAARSPYRHVITRAVGTSAAVEPTIVDSEVLPGDLYLLCSDGLTREIDDHTLAAFLHELAEGDLKFAASFLIERANAMGGHDNSTVILVRVEGTERPAPRR